MKKLTLALCASLTLTGCYTNQAGYQPAPQPQVIYVQEQREMPTSKLARIGIGGRDNPNTTQTYGIREVDGGPTRYYNIQKQ